MTADPPHAVPMAEPASADAGVPRRLRIRAEHVRDYGVLVAFAVLFIALSLGSAPFLSTAICSTSCTRTRRSGSSPAR